MPARPAWYAQLPAIRDALERSPALVLDRAAIEKLFGLGRRQAINLMHRFDGYLSGRHWLIPRENLLAQIDRVAREPAYGKVAKAKTNILAYIAEVEASSPTLRRPLPERDTAPALSAALEALLPEGVEISSPGRMLIRYQTIDELLARLNGVAMLAVKNFAGFADAVPVPEERI